MWVKKTKLKASNALINHKSYSESTAVSTLAYVSEVNIAKASFSESAWQAWYLACLKTKLNIVKINKLDLHSDNVNIWKIVENKEEDLVLNRLHWTGVS